MLLDCLISRSDSVVSREIIDPPPRQIRSYSEDTESIIKTLSIYFTKSDQLIQGQICLRSDPRKLNKKSSEIRKTIDNIKNTNRQTKQIKKQRKHFLLEEQHENFVAAARK